MRPHPNSPLPYAEKRRGVACPLRVGLVAGCAALLFALAFAAAAQATITGSSITTPADHSYIAGAATASFTVSGTAAGTGSVDIDCTAQGSDPSGNSASALATNVPVSGGNFSVSISDSQVSGGSGSIPACVLRALPSGTGNGVDFSGFSGPLVGDDVLFDNSTPASPQYDFLFYSSEFAGQVGTVSSAGKAGVHYLGTIVGDAGPGHNPDAGNYPVFLFGAYLNRVDFSGAKSQVVVDGKNAYPPADLHDNFGDLSGEPGFQPITYSGPVVDQGTGAATVVETDPLMRCVAMSDPAPGSVNSTTCPALADSGVKLVRTITYDHSGAQLHFHDAYQSTDATSHAIALRYTNTPEYPAGGSDADTTYNFPWNDGTAYSTHTMGGSEAAPPAGPHTIYLDPNGGAPSAPSGQTYSLGALTFAPGGPGGAQPVNFFNGSGGNYAFELPFNLTVPATASATVDMIYSVADSSAARDALVADATSALTPISCAGDAATTAFNTAKSFGLTCSAGPSATLTYATVPSSLPAKGTVTFSGSTATYTPNSNQTGTDSFPVNVSDQFGHTATDTVTVTISRPAAPSCTGDAASTAFNTPTTFALTSCTGTSLSYAVDPAHGPSKGTATISGNQLTYSPQPGQTGADTFTVNVSDPYSQMAADTVTVTISKPGAPACQNDSATTPFNTATTITLHCTGSNLSYATSSSHPPAKGSVSYSGNTVAYTPNPNAFGSDTFQVIATDGAGQSAPDSVAVTINRPAAPVCPGNAAVTPADTSVNVTLTCSGATALSYALAGAAQKGTATIAGHTLTYKPNRGASGVDTLTVTATDATGQSTNDSVTITIDTSQATTSFTIATPRVDVKGDITVTLGAKQGGSFDILGTHDDPKQATLALLHPGYRRFAYAPTIIRLARAGHVTVTLRPTPTGRALLVRHRRLGWALNVRLNVLFTPRVGAPARKDKYVLILRARH